MSTQTITIIHSISISLSCRLLVLHLLFSFLMSSLICVMCSRLDVSVLFCQGLNHLCEGGTGTKKEREGRTEEAEERGDVKQVSMV